MAEHNNDPEADIGTARKQPQRKVEPVSPDRDFFFNDTATTEIYTLSLQDALPIYQAVCPALLGDRISDAPASKKPQGPPALSRSEEHTSELQSLRHLVCRLLL